MATEKLREEIACLFAHGLSDVEVSGAISSSGFAVKNGYVPNEIDLIAVIREMMEREDEGIQDKEDSDNGR